MQTPENRFHLSINDPRYWPKYAASSKNGKLFLADFSDFYLAVSASVNDANYRKLISFITPMTRDKGRNMLPAVKTENLLSPIFMILIQIKIRKLGDKKFSVFTAGSIFSTEICCQIKIRKLGDKKFSFFSAGSIFRPISRVMGVINEFSFR